MTKTECFRRYLVRLMRTRGLAISYRAPTPRFMDPRHPLTERMLEFVETTHAPGLMIFTGGDGRAKWAVEDMRSQAVGSVFEAEALQDRAVASIYGGNLPDWYQTP